MVKHLKRCGGGTIKDVIDMTKDRKQQHINAILAGVPSLDSSDALAYTQGRELSRGPPNVTVIPQQKSMENGCESEDEQQQYSCDQCSYISCSSGELKKHQRGHLEDKPFVCKTCNYSSKWKCDLKKHLRTYNHTSAVPLTYGGHGRKPADWESGVAPGVGSSSSPEPSDDDAVGSDNRHNSSPKISSQSGGGGKFKCKQCEFSTDDLPSFLQHKVLDSSARRPADTIATTATPTKHRRKPLKQNITKTVVESPTMAYPCEWCSWVGQNSIHLYNHVHTEHPQDTAEIQIYRGATRKVARRRLKHCTKCAYITDNVSTLQRHMAKHGKKAKYICSYCDYGVEREHIIEYHMSLVHKQQDGNPAAIANGDITDSDDEVIDMEENSMDSEETEIHEQLDNNLDFDGEEDIDDNDKADDKEGGFSILQIHADDQMTFACRQCTYKSDSLSNVNNHARQHGANKKYKCEFCDYSLNQLRHILNHMKTAHGNEHLAKSDDDPESETNVKASDVVKTEWDIVAIVANEDDEDDDESPSKRRRLSQSPATVLQYTCRTCEFNTTNKAAVQRHRHVDKNANSEKDAVDINRNKTNSQQVEVNV